MSSPMLSAIHRRRDWGTREKVEHSLRVEWSGKKVGNRMENWLCQAEKQNSSVSWVSESKSDILVVEREEK